MLRQDKAWSKTELFGYQTFAGKTGFMTKKGGFRKNWLRRWFMLSCDQQSGAPQLLYFADSGNGWGREHKELKGYASLPVRAVLHLPHTCLAETRWCWCGNHRSIAIPAAHGTIRSSTAPGATAATEVEIQAAKRTYLLRCETDVSAAE
jgi:hypothetical protein